MRRGFIALVCVIGAVPIYVFAVQRSPGTQVGTTAAMEYQAQPAPAKQTVPTIPFEVVPNFFKYSIDMNFGETLSVAVNSKGSIVVLNHPGSATSGPLYGAATTQLWEFDRTGKFVRELGKGVYGLGYAHTVRFDKYDNLWVVDKGTNAVTKFNPAGYVTMNLGRRPEGYDSFPGHYHRDPPEKAVARDNNFDGPTDIGWDADDNIFVSDGYVNSRIAKIDKTGKWIKSFGSYGEGGATREREPWAVQKPAQHAGGQAGQRLRWRPRQPPHPGLRQGRKFPPLYASHRGVRQVPPAGARQHAERAARRDGTVGHVHDHQRIDTVSVCGRL